MSGVVSFVVTTRLRRSPLSRLHLLRFRHFSFQGGDASMNFSLSIPTAMTTPKITRNPLQHQSLGCSQRVTTEVTTCHENEAATDRTAFRCASATNFDQPVVSQHLSEWWKPLD